MNNYKTLEYLATLYNKPLDIDNGKEYEEQKHLILSSKYYDLKKEYHYFNKLCKEFNGIANHELLGFMIRRNISTENIVLWKTIYHIVSLTDNQLIDLGLDRADIKKFRGIYNLVMNNVSIKKFSTLIREVRVSLKRRFKTNKFKYNDIRLNNEEPYLIGVQDKNLYLALYNSDDGLEYTDSDDYYIDLYTGDIHKSELIDKKTILISPGHVAVMNYDTLYKYINIEKLDIFWV